jgi:hypothetical protein
MIPLDTGKIESVVLGLKQTQLPYDEIYDEKNDAHDEWQH